MNDHGHLPETGFVRLPDVLRVFPVGRSTWWLGVKEGRYPPAIKLGPRITAWRVEDIRALISKARKMTRRHDVHRAKRHLSYSVAEVCETFRVGSNTVWAWRKAGLTPIEDRRPYLFHGTELVRFLTLYNKPRQPCGPGEIYCVGCKAPVAPASDVAVLKRLSATTGNLIGKCPRCSHHCCRRVRLSELAAKGGSLAIQYEDGAVPLPEGGDAARSDVCGEVER